MYFRNKIIHLFLFWLVFYSQLFAQQDSTITVEYILNNILDDATIEKEDSQLYDLIEQLLENPININKANKTELMTIPFMDIESADNIIKYRKKHGKFFSTNELSMINGLSSILSKTLKYFVVVRKTSKAKAQPFIGLYSFKFRSRVIQNLQERRGFIDTVYIGSGTKAYNRIKFNINPKISMGGLIEKDAGEKYYWDFYSAHISIKNIVPLTHIIIGDFTVEFGQGLSMWSPYSFSKSSDATNSIIKRGRNISVYTSSGESNFLRGAAVNTKVSNLSVTAFYSSLYLDAVLYPGSVFRSIKNDGFHRTEKESLNSGNLKDKTYGANLSYNFFDKVTLGLLYYQKSFNHTFLPNNYPSINGDKFEFASVTYDLSIKNIFFSGELSYFQNSIASINTIQLALVKNFIITAIVRNYPKNYFSFYANGFGEKSTTNNEFGIYTGFKWKTVFGEINFYLDQFKFPKPSIYIPLPSNGDELSLSYANKFNNGIRFYIRYFNERKEVLGIVDKENSLVSQRLQKIRGEVTFRVNRYLRLRSRLELLYLSVDQTSKKETGFLLFHDVQGKLPFNLIIYGRFIFFQTDSYASRIYEFENDLTGVMNNLALYGIGMRWYLLLRYRLLNYFQLSLKYSELYKPNEKFLGSGYNLIPTNLDNRVSVQIDITF